jgi:hypothetical protein
MVDRSLIVSSGHDRERGERDKRERPGSREFSLF